MKEKYRPLIVSFIAVLIGLLSGMLIILLIGKNPFAGIAALFVGSLGSLERFGNMLASATQLILVGLSVSFAFKAGLFNIGGAGQMLMGGLIATAVSLTIHLDQVLMIPLILTSAALAGALWGLIPGLLKAYFNVHEVVSTIMLNQIALWIAYYTVQVYLKGPQETESATISPQGSLNFTWLSDLFGGSVFNFGIIVAIAAVFVTWRIFKRSKFGFEIKATGFNPLGAQFAGFSVKKNIIIALTISGLLAGLAGATHYTGYARNFQIGEIPHEGFDGIAVALLGGLNSFGVLASGIFFAMISDGKNYMTAATSIPNEISDTIIAAIIYFSAISVFIKNFIDWYQKKKKIASLVESGGDNE